MNGEERASGTWSGYNIAINVDGLTIGTYAFVCTVYDLDGNSAGDTVVVIVTGVSSSSVSSSQTTDSTTVTGNGTPGFDGLTILLGLAILYVFGSRKVQK